MRRQDSHIPRLQPRTPGTLVPLTAEQLEYMRALHDEDGLSARMCALAVRIVGPLNCRALEKSVEALLRRHESLRTRIVFGDEVPSQLIDAPREYHLPVVVMEESDSAEVEREANRLAQAFLEKRIDLAVGPVFECRVWRLKIMEHILVVVLDHVVADATSCDILSSELWELYRCEVSRAPLTLPSQPAQFADYAVWQEQRAMHWLERHGAYWHRRSVGNPCARVPQDKTPRNLANAIPGIANFSFGKTLSTRLRDMAKRERTLLPILVLALYIAAVARWCDQQDILLRFVSHGRSRFRELRGMIGFLAGSVFLRIVVNGELRFLDLLNQTSQEVCAAYDHEDGARTLACMVDCATEIVFNWLPTSGAINGGRASVDDELRIEPVPLQSNRPSKFYPLFFESSDGIGATIHFRSDIVLERTVKRFGDDLRLLAEAFVRDPAASINSALMQVDSWTD